MLVIARVSSGTAPVDLRSVRRHGRVGLVCRDFAEARVVLHQLGRWNSYWRRPDTRAAKSSRALRIGTGGAVNRRSL
ncbi:hypothetical protein PsYK624_016440 [Phanerochaete sordida]|uniref:Uncharacterized protein n=1 Tax=Phanerochaete sordida TaxID=48140 RepID=A0A9P3G080_9APHY|nr:hypothetical protein PsYK624_016440 [Phanerochaete sordida]